MQTCHKLNCLSLDQLSRMLTFDPILSHLTPLSADTVPLFESYKLKLETEQFICRGLFWTSDEQESYRFSIQYHEQPNVLGINNELLGILIKVPTTTTITSQFILLCIAIILTFVCTKLKFLKTSLCVVIGDVVQLEYS